ncbi:amino acid adenylation domain-containing protein [Nocardia sp. NPDC052566]|uniref:amino acid adenylation domain-containing protein n=1 Tax=Nocardia sp. NPDC052566 TaxID=3364330 RepID=UPI0037C7C24B
MTTGQGRESVPTTARASTDQLAAEPRASAATTDRPDQHRTVQAWWNTARTPYRRRCVHRMIEAVAAEQSSLLAVEFGATRLTYRQFNEAANRLARHLVAVGVGPGQMVGVCMDRCVEQIVAIVAVLKAGATVLPLDATYPPQRLAYMLADSAAVVTITTAALLRREPVLAQQLRGLTQVQLDTHAAAVDRHDDANLTEEPPAETAAYCIYTSGSTGEPKGVLVEHATLANLVGWHRDTWLSAPGTRTLLYSPISFDVAFHEILAGLCTGATLVQVDDDTRRNPMALLKFVASAQIQKWYLPFVALQQVAQAARTVPVPTDLAECIVGGEVLRVTPQIRDFARRTGCVIHNHYGSTECVDAATYTLSGDPDSWPDIVPVGRASVANTNLYILRPDATPAEPGEIGELYAEGDCLARGYHDRPALTASRFVASPFGVQGDRLYRMGDLGRYLPDGTIECLGRVDNQVKIRGFRVEPSEIEAVLAEHPDVAECVVVATTAAHSSRRLVAYVVPAGPRDATLATRLRKHAASVLAEHMVPTSVTLVQALPLTPSGKVDARALATRSAAYPPPASPHSSPTTVRDRVTAIWCDLLEVAQIDTRTGYFELGADSLMLVHAHQRICAEFKRELPAETLFRYPTVEALTSFLCSDSETEVLGCSDAPAHGPAAAGDGAVAIIGMACRVPGADTLEQFWSNLRQGVESITPLTDSQVLRLPHDQTSDPHFVAVAASIPGIEYFDADFFGYSPAEAAVIDPQQRLFLESAWQALENAGVDVNRYRVGVYAGAAMSTYLINNVLPIKARSGIFLSHRYFDDATELRIEQGNARDHLTMRASYKLGLRGPSVNVQSTCSTSLVAVHLARQALLAGDCEVALAGGVSIITPQNTGYLWREGMMVSRHGHVRAFDADADGTVFGDGLGVVVLKPLAAALADHDHIYAVITGSAVNNDGADKIDYAGPNVTAQAEVIAAAHRDAGISAADISYVETHGTATILGDPIEIAGLTEAFGRSTDRAGQWCAIGSVKTNIGHLDDAAGVVGLIKTTLALHHRQIPPSLGFTTANPRAGMEATPFTVNTALGEWTSAAGQPLRAGVSSFGMGGTNCHLVLEQAPPRQPRSAPAAERTAQLLPISARTPQALRENLRRYHDHLDNPDRQDFADVAFSAATGRRHFDCRAAIVARDSEDARAELAQLLNTPDPGVTITGERPAVAFLCAGHGAQYPQMGRSLYETQPVYRAAFDRCDAIVGPLIGASLIEMLYGRDPAERIDANPIAHPALFSVGYSLAALWQSWGVRPDLVLGYSLGEYLAACLAGILTVEDGLRLVSTRAQLVDELTGPGAMVYLPADEHTVAAALAGNPRVSIAVLNAPDGTVISGDLDAVDAVVADFRARGLEPMVLPVSRAFHSPAMTAVAEAYRAVAESVSYSPPHCNIIANLTGELASARELQTADYWVRHMVDPVRFTRTMTAAGRCKIDAFVEIGPKATLSSLGRRCLPDSPALWLPSLAPRDPEATLSACRSLYLAGVPVDWQGMHRPHPRRRVPVPTYSFQRRRHWLDAPDAPAPSGPVTSAAPRAERLPHRPVAVKDLSAFEIIWQPMPQQTMEAVDEGAAGFVFIGPSGDLTAQLAARLRTGATPCAVIPMDWNAAPDHAALVVQMQHLSHLPRPIRIVLLADCYTGADPAPAMVSMMAAARTVLCAAADSTAAPALWFLTFEDDPCGAGLAALARTLVAEHPELVCSALTLPAELAALDLERLLSCLHHGGEAAEQLTLRPDGLYRARLAARSPLAEAQALVRAEGTYVITGGTGALGLQVACALARHRPGRLVLISRTGTPRDSRAWQALVDSGVPTQLVRADVTDESQLRAILDDCGDTLRGVIHCAGVLDDAIFVRHTMSRIDDVLAAKVRGAWLLHTLTTGLDLDFFVLFSSLASVVGYRGQAAYAAANGCLDGLAAYRRRQGLAATAISWGSWDGPGMSATLSRAQRAEVLADGESLLPPDQAAAATVALTSCGAAHLVIAAVDWDHFAPTHPTPTIEALVTHYPTTHALGGPAPGPFAAQLRNATPEQARNLVRHTVIEAIAAQLDCDGAELDPRRGLEDMGLDSLAALDLRTALQTQLGVPLSATVAFDHPNVDALTAYLADRHFAEDIAAAAREIAPLVDQPSPAPALGSSDTAAAVGAESSVAIVGMACRFPGADNPADFWRLLLSGHDVVTDIPADRWDIEGLYDPSPQAPGRMYVRRAATITDLDCFDAGYFGISPREAAAMDPRHRLLLQSTWHALEDAGIDPTSLRDSDTGVFVAADEFLNDYLRGAHVDLGSDPYLATGTTLSMTAGRLSYKLGCHGPSLVLATGCSSALVAVHTAVRAIRAGDCAVAIVGSGKLLLDPAETVQLCKLGAMAPDGRSKVFSALADGYGRGEGVATIVLKRLARALADGDPVHAVIRGTAINHDGPSSGLTVPNGAAQTAVITRAMRDAHVTPDQVGFIETHGTGTQLGDPIELNALATVFGGRERAVFVSSAKATIGHLEEAAGLAGLLKAVLVLQHGVIPAQPHSQPLNDKVDWASVPLTVNAHTTEWPNGAARIAGVSSFGLSGTNAHVVIESAPVPPPSTPSPERAHLFVFSGRDHADLHAVVARAAAAITDSTDSAQIAYTLQVGRQHHHHRLAVVAATAAEVRIRLHAVLSNAAVAACVHRGQAAPQPQSLTAAVAERLYAERDLPGLAAHWCQGYTIAWDRLYPDRIPRRISLPGYPFKREHTGPKLSAGPAAQPEPVQAAAGALSSAVSVRSTPDPSGIHAAVAALLGFAPDGLDPEASLEAVGADSLMFTRLAHLLRDDYQIEIPFQQLLEDATSVNTILALVQAHQPGAGRDKPTPAPPVSAPMPQSGPATLAGTPAPATALTERQQAFVDEVSAAYSARTAESKSRAAQDRPRMANCRTTPFRPLLKEMCYPIIATRSQGARFWDVDGNAYLDLAMGYGTHFFGYQPAFVLDALREQIADGVHIGPQVSRAGHVARLLCDLVGAERAVFCNSGTEAVMAALRFARAATGRNRIVMFEGSYHGWSDLTLALPGGTQRSLAMARGIGSGAMGDVVVLEYGAPHSLEVIAELSGELAAVLVEPVQSRRPDLQPREFLQQLRELTRAAGTVLIFDEVVTGLRVGPHGAQGWSGVSADLATYGKILGGGLPIGAVAGRAELLDTIDGGAWDFGDDSCPRVPMTFYGGTFNRNPLSMAAAEAVLTRLAADGAQLAQQASDHVAWLTEEFNTFCQREGYPLRIVAFTSMFRFITDGDYRLLHSSFELELFFHLLILHEVYVLETRVCYLSASHTTQDMHCIAEVAKDCLRQMRRGGFFPAPVPALTVSEPTSQILADARLELAVATGAGPDGHDRPEQVLLTGATGFLGRFLLRELLAHTGAPIHCLVRARDPEHATARVLAALATAGDLDDGWADRIEAVPADLSAPRFGLSQPRWQQLAAELSAIYHCGAQVNSLSSYTKLKPANVTGTRELLRLAAEHHPTPLHHVSSDAVFDAYGYLRNSVLYEDQPLTHGETLYGGGYAETKWVADKLIEAARAQGLPASIYRPGAIIAATSGGCGQPADFITRFLRGIIALQACPEMDATIDFAPADYVAAAIVDLSRRREPGITFHLTHPDPVRYDDLIAMLRATGYPLEVVALHHWQARIEQLRFEDDNPLYPLIPVLTAAQPYFRTSRLDVSNTRAAAPLLRMSCPPLSELIPMYLERLRTHGFLHPAPQPAEQVMTR